MTRSILAIGLLSGAAYLAGAAGVGRTGTAGVRLAGAVGAQLATVVGHAALPIGAGDWGLARETGE